MDKQRKKLLVRVMVSLLVVWVVGHWIVSAVKYIHEREARQHADEWLHQAERDAHPDMTKEDAIRWLRQNGADQVSVGEAIDKGNERLLVAGDRRLNQKGVWTDPMQARLDFFFDTQWRFEEVKLEIWPH